MNTPKTYKLIHNEPDDSYCSYCLLDIRTLEIVRSFSESCSMKELFESLKDLSDKSPAGIFLFVSKNEDKRILSLNKEDKS